MLVLSGYITGSSPMVSPESLLIHPRLIHRILIHRAQTHVKDAYFAPARGVVEDHEDSIYFVTSTVQ